MSTNGKFRTVEIRYRSDEKLFVMQGDDLDEHLRVLEGCEGIKVLGKIFDWKGRPESLTEESLSNYAGLGGGK